MENSNTAIIISVIGLIVSLASMFITFFYNRKTDIKNYFTLALSLTQNVKDHIKEISVKFRYGKDEKETVHWGYNSLYEMAIYATNSIRVNEWKERKLEDRIPRQMIVERDSDDDLAIAYKLIAGMYRNRFYSIIDSILLSAKVLKTKSVRVSRFIDELDSRNPKNTSDICSIALTTLGTTINSYLWVLILVFYYYEEDNRLKRLLTDKHLCGNIENQVDNVLTDSETRKKLIDKAKRIKQRK